ncbi:hypothetical protein TROLL_101 [Bacillus phage Troll]|uniref:Uncharacterized protein n=5 Tax=Caudoviricetes TaxID=2731619 RepID=A0A7U3T8T9_9CAUD|nr:hypothetical protein TROLL_101 [Bacillus phage Troll]YP_009206453.1 hypothetical protein AVV02_gp098 [Bacillus phage AvesoBmore]YP_009289975.1 hypothetical protein BI003_gp096 [Bacillus phage Phrodo]AMW61475.1 hypothetical protein JUGLONE_96 [Bacillus phage Juglone]QDH49789.1 hypothetical protein BEYONPHE_102 [Bacillus phage Beyonphe]QPY77332.1 hypothetical protein ANTHOS_95 [Bacillus phage Anthos]UGO48908.1 hypothetical protein JARJAR_94 [Bacillus phage vB_BanH_JarJar]UGO50399.1 hypothet
MNTQQPQGKPINPNFIMKEQYQTIHVLTDEVIQLRAYVSQLEEENLQLRAAVPEEVENKE